MIEIGLILWNDSWLYRSIALINQVGTLLLFFCTIKRPYELCVLFNNQNVFGKIYFQSASKFKNEIALSIVHVWCGYHHAHIH